MPYSFTLPTTSSFSFSTYLETPTHPSLPIAASTARASVRSSLKSHKRLTPPAKDANLPHLIRVIEHYIPYLLAIDIGFGSSTNVDIVLKTNQRLSWRPTISASTIPGREQARVALSNLEYEIFFVLATLSYCQNLLARSILTPLNSLSGTPPTPEQRTLSITTATRHLLSSASIHTYLSARADDLSTTVATTPPCADVSPPVLRALAALAHAEATLLAVAKDDPYPSAAAQAASATDKEWMIRAPSMPKVRAHLYTRLCLTGASHAATARDLLAGDAGGKVGGKIDEALVKYCDGVRRVGRARACRFIAIDTDASGKTGEAIAWIRVALGELGLKSSVEDDNVPQKSRLGFSRMKDSFKEVKIDKKTEGDLADEARVLRAFEKKWMKENDTINMQTIPPSAPLLAQLPTGREIYTVKPYEPPTLGPGVLASLRAQPEDGEQDEESDSEDDKERSVPGSYGGSGSYY